MNTATGTVSASLLRPYSMFARTFCNTPEPEPAPEPAKKPDDKPTKIELTQADIDAKIEAALSAERTKTEVAAKKKREEDEAAEATRKGEFEKLAKQQQERADTLALENRNLKAAHALNAHLAEKHPDYISTAKYILPLIDASKEGAELTKAIETAAGDYVKDNPRAPKGSAGPQPQSRTANRVGDGRSPRQQPIAGRMGNGSIGNF